MIITQTPLRISFLGGNTDFREFYTRYGGCVLTTAIDKYVYCIVTKRFDDDIRIIYTKNEVVKEVSQVEHELVRESLKKTGVKKGVEINFIADIPSKGSGLGSSASVLVGTLNALYHYTGHSPSAEQLAKEAVEIEADVLKKPVGVQDQYIAAYGGLRFIEFEKNGEIKVNKVNLNHGYLDNFNNCLMLFYTGISRSSSTLLADVKKNIRMNTKSLMKNKALAKKGYRALCKNNVDDLGKLLNDYWKLKKTMSANISNGKIDSMYEKAMKAGALGGKVCGAGGGGFLVFVVPSNKRSKVRKALKDYRELPAKVEIDGSKVIFNVRRR